MPDEAAIFTFLQVSDVHLDSKLNSLRLALPAAKRQLRASEILAAAERAFTVAQEKKVDAVIIPGDLWDADSVSSSINRLIEAAGALGQIPVVIAPGNHDYCSADSLYNSDVLTSRGMRPWPDNVHIFRSSSWQLFGHPLRADVSFTGRAFTVNTPVSQRLLAQSVPRQMGGHNLLVFHGSLDGYKGGDSGWPGKVTAPFSAAELLALEFTYAAVGHYHDHTEIRGGGKLLGAYAGCLVGRGIDESGPRSAIYGTITGDGQCTLERLELDQRRVVAVSCDITGSTAAEVVADVRNLLDSAGARPGSDIVYLHLEGRHVVGGEPTYLAEQLGDIYWHFVVVDESRPDYLTQRFDRRTTEGRFIQSMLELKRQSIEAGGYIVDSSYDCELTPDLIEDALYYGLDALKQKKVSVRYVD